MMPNKRSIILLFLILFILKGINAQTLQDTQVIDTLLKQNIDSCERMLNSCQRKLDSLMATLNLSQDHNQELEEQIALQIKKIAHLEEQTRLFEQTIEKMEQEDRFNKEKQELNNEVKDKEITHLQNLLKEREDALRNQQESSSRLGEERERYMHLTDSLKHQLNEAEKKIIRTNEELKYTQQRAREAEAKVNAATAKKKKVVAIQGIALKTFRTPNWSIAPDKIEDGSIVYRIVNKNGGNVEFDYTAGASVMLWDLTKKVNETENDTVSQKLIDIKKFDQEFSYSLGLYVGFGGSNLFKNFYVGPSFKFLDFFHLSAGINICEYEMLTGNFKEGDILPTGLSLTDQISKVWKPKPFVSLSFDLDFISYIKK